ncbi:MAG: hypothetical protein AABZ16_02965 [candidate division NC10 bacterium]
MRGRGKMFLILGRLANSKKKLTGHVIAGNSLFDVVRRTAKIAGM